MDEISQTQISSEKRLQLFLKRLHLEVQDCFPTNFEQSVLSVAECGAFSKANNSNTIRGKAGG